MPNKILLPCLLSSLLSTSALADGFMLSGSGGRATLSNTLSNYGIVSGDAMQPIYGNRDEFLYGNMMGGYGSDDSFVVSPGAGIRTIRDNRLYGARLFADYARTASKQNFWTISPGVEWMNSRFDANVNAYVPTQRAKRSGVGVATGTVSFEPGTHDQYDDLLVPFTVVGDGLDMAVGYSFSGYKDLRSRVYGGAYYYDTPLNARNIAGLAAGVQLPLADRLSMSLDNSYDNVNRYTIGFKVTISIGADTTTMSGDVHDRAAEPTQRHIGMIGSATGTTVQQATKADRTLEYSDVYFLSANGTGDGTYGNAANLSQTTLDLANAQNSAGARLYLQSGPGADYVVDSTTAIGIGGNVDLGLGLYDHQDVFGRSADYKTAAISSQPQIVVDGLNNYNGFVILGSQNTLSDITITSTGGYINGTTPTTSTGIISYNTSPGSNQTITLTNVNIHGLADGMYALNDSNTGTLTINTTNSTFSNNGGDMGLDNIQFQGYGTSGASGLIAINASGASNSLIINAVDSHFDNNGVFTGQNSYINNNNFSVASGLTAINNSDGGTLEINATGSSFDGNGQLSGAGTNLLANEAGPNGNSINIAAATGLLATNNGANGNLNITAASSTFNNNGALGGDSALIQAGALAAGDNVNLAVASGVVAFNNTTGTGSLSMTATDSQFDGNGTLGGMNSAIKGLAYNSSLGPVVSVASATGAFAYNNTSNAGNLDMVATRSNFDNNGSLTGNSSSLSVETADSGLNSESAIAEASGFFALSANNQGNNAGNFTVTATDSTFNGNAALGNNALIQALNYNGLSSGSANMAAATGLGGYHIGAGALTINSTGSQFSSNAAMSSGAGFNVSGADSNIAAASGLAVFNNSGVAGNLYVNSLTGSDFTNNDGYGIYGYAPIGSFGQTVIDYTGATFSGNSTTNNQGISDGATTWTP